MAGEVHPVPFRTRKLSPLAPMVLRSSPWESRTSLTNEGHLRAEAARNLTAEFLEKMRGIGYGPEQAAVLAVKAGATLLCSTDFDVQIPAVLAAVKDGSISRETLDRAVRCNLTWKQQLGIWAVES